MTPCGQSDRLQTLQPFSNRQRLAPSRQKIQFLAQFNHHNTWHCIKRKRSGDRSPWFACNGMARSQVNKSGAELHQLQIRLREQGLKSIQTRLLAPGESSLPDTPER